MQLHRRSCRHLIFECCQVPCITWVTGCRQVTFDCTYKQTNFLCSTGWKRWVPMHITAHWSGLLPTLAGFSYWYLHNFAVTNTSNILPSVILQCCSRITGRNRLTAPTQMLPLQKQLTIPGAHAYPGYRFRFSAVLHCWNLSFLRGMSYVHFQVRSCERCPDFTVTSIWW